MEQINIHAAKTHLSSLVERAAAGESFIIAKAGRPMVKVSPYQPQKPRSLIGFMKGKITIPDDFDIDKIGEEEVIALFEGAEIHE